MFCLTISAKRQDEDYDEEVEETLQDEVSLLQHQCLQPCVTLQMAASPNVTFSLFFCGLPGLDDGETSRNISLTLMSDY